MARRGDGAAEAAAAAASEAARVLQARQQEKAKDEPKAEPEAPVRKDEAPPRQFKRWNSEREQIMEEIRASRGEKEPKAEEPPKEEPKAEPKAETPVEAPKTEPETPAAPSVEAPAAPKMVRVKIDGEESDVPEAEVEEYGGVRPYQIAKALENRLRKQTEAHAKQMAEMTALAKQHQQSPKPPEPTDDEFIKSKIDIVRFGTPEESAAALREVMARSAKPVDPQALVSQATNQIMHDQAVRDFDKEFSDISASPMQLKLVLALRQERMDQAQGQPIDWPNFYRTIGTEVRSAFGRQSQPAKTPTATSDTPSPASEKEARKASITNLPAAAARAELPKEERPETREESLNRMRKARGLPLH